jgi:methyl-accepting chemotaxis protein
VCPTGVAHVQVCSGHRAADGAPGTLIRSSDARLAGDAAFNGRELEGIERLDAVHQVLGAASHFGLSPDAGRARLTEALTSSDRLDSSIAEAAERVMATSGSFTEQRDALDALALALVTAGRTIADESELSLDPESAADSMQSIATDHGLALAAAVEQVASLTMGLDPDEVTVDMAGDLGGLRSTVVAERLRVRTSVDAIESAGLRSGGGTLTDDLALLVSRADLAEQRLSYLLAGGADVDFRPVGERATSQLTMVADELRQEISLRLNDINAQRRLAHIEVAIGIGLALCVVIVVTVATRRSARHIRSTLGAMAAGSLVPVPAMGGRDEFGQMERAVDECRDRMRIALGHLADSSVSTVDRVAQLSDVAESLSAQADGSRVGAGEIAVATSQLARSIEDIAQNVVQAQDQMIAARTEVGSASEAISALDVRTADVAGVVARITEIAELTNLLALNATIESARAGAAGRGFAVVADEVKQLAGETAHATHDIIEAIDAIRRDVEVAVVGMARVGRAVDAVDAVQATIAGAAHEQAAATGQISDTAALFAARIERTASDAVRLKQVSSSLDLTAAEGAELVSGFRLVSPRS